MIYLVQTFDSMILYLPGLKIIFLELPRQNVRRRNVVFKDLWHSFVSGMIVKYSVFTGYL